jgi:hypothetical protein
MTDKKCNHSFSVDAACENCGEMISSIMRKLTFENSERIGQIRRLIMERDDAMKENAELKENIVCLQDIVEKQADTIESQEVRWSKFEAEWKNLVKMWCVLEATNDTEDYFKFRTRFMEFDIKMQELSSGSKCPKSWDKMLNPVEERASYKGIL